MDSIAQTRSDVNPSDEENVRTARKRAAETTDERFSRYNAELKETFRQNIDQWEREGRPQDEVFAVGVARNIVQGLGAQESTVRLYGEKVDRILHDHPEITLKEIKQIPQILDDPAVVLKSKYRGEDNSRLIFIGNVKAKNGLPVMVILDVNSVEKRISLGSIERVMSTYTKTSGLARFLQSSEYVYVNEKEATKLLINAGLPIIQRPASMNGGFVGSISHYDDKVNIHAKSFSEIFSDNGVRTARKRAAETADDRFSHYNAELKETFRQNIDQWEREGRPKDTYFDVSIAGDIIQGLGAAESKVRLYGDKVDRILHDHPEITLKEIRQIPQILNDPAVILKSKFSGEENSRLVFIGDVKAKNGLPVMVILDVNSLDKNILGSIEKVASVYTKTSGLGNFLRTSGFVYVNKKKATDLLIVTDLHNGLHPAPMIDGFVGSISHPGGNVKIHAKSFSEKILKVSSTVEFTVEISLRRILRRNLV